MGDKTDALRGFYGHFGIEQPVDDQPRTWLENSVLEERPQPLKRPLPSREEGHPALQAKSLEELKQIMMDFNDCLLKSTATRLVFADGNPRAPVMFVGEAPGREEDLSGLPFVGRAGRLLDKMLASVSLDRTMVYITNLIPWRPPANRTPTVEEQALCAPFVHRHISLVKPRVLVCLGAIAAKKLLPLEKGHGILKARGRWLSYTMESGEEIEALATFHPAYLLRQPSQKKLAWIDLLLLKEKIGSFTR